MDVLSSMTCIPCRKGEPTVTDAEISGMQSQIPAWKIIERDGVKRLERTFSLSDFAQALAFTNEVGRLAEEEGHHPVIVTEWGRVTVTWWTHAIGGLHRNDLIMAAKTDDAYTDVA